MKDMWPMFLIIILPCVAFGYMLGYSFGYEKGIDSGYNLAITLIKEQ